MSNKIWRHEIWNLNSQPLLSSGSWWLCDISSWRGRRSCRYQVADSPLCSPPFSCHTGRSGSSEPPGTWWWGPHRGGSRGVQMSCSARVHMCTPAGTRWRVTETTASCTTAPWCLVPRMNNRTKTIGQPPVSEVDAVYLSTRSTSIKLI